MKFRDSWKFLEGTYVEIFRVLSSFEFFFELHGNLEIIGIEFESFFLHPRM